VLATGRPFVGSAMSVWLQDAPDQPADRGGRTPAVALTAYARSEDRTRALLAGLQNHVTKPIAPGELLAAVASLATRPDGG